MDAKGAEAEQVLLLLQQSLLCTPDKATQFLVTPSYCKWQVEHLQPGMQDTMTT